MPKITFENHVYDCCSTENLLDSLSEHGVNLPSGCRSGSCHVCLCMAKKGTPPSESQRGLKDTLKVQGFFLSCLCKPEHDLEIAFKKNQTHLATVIQKVWLNDHVISLRLSKPAQFDYEAGQFVNVYHEDGVCIRSYSLASTMKDNFLELHIGRIPNGKMSSWLCDAVQEGDQLTFSDASGDCFYIASDLQQTLFLAGTGTGLAPLYSIVQKAIESKHTGMIYFYHGALSADDLYYQAQLQALSSKYANIHYVPCVLHGEPPVGGKKGALDALLMQKLEDLHQVKVYLCGDSDLVGKMQQAAFLSGVSMKDIYTDAFTFSTPT